MLKLFFHRDSRFVRAIEAIGAVLFIPIVVKEHGSWAFWFYLFEYLFIRFSYNYNWYHFPSPLWGEGQGEGRHLDELGIRLHFKKALVATSYIILIMNAAFLSAGKTVFLYAGMALLAAILYLHAVLLYLHFRDKDDRPPNYFSR